MNVHEIASQAQYSVVLVTGETISARVRRRVIEVRERRGLTQKALAEKLAEIVPDDEKTWASPANINRYENGSLGITLDRVGHFAQALGVPLTMLVGSSNEMERHLDSLDPIAQGLHEALQTGKLDPQIVLGIVNGIRRLADLEPLPPRHASTPAPEKT